MKILLLFALSLSLFSCREQENTVIDPKMKATFKANVNGTGVEVIENDRIQNNDSSVIWNPAVGDRGGAGNYDIYNFELYLGGFLSIDKYPINTISINFVEYISSVDKDEDGVIKEAKFNEIFSEGAKQYSSNVLEKPGISIEWYDLNRQRWTTNKYFSIYDASTYIPGTPNFSNTSFKVVKSISISPILPVYKYSKYLELSFNCNLYNVNGDSIKMTNAYFKGIYSIFNH